MNADRVLVTGAGGFIAKHCVAELLRAGFEVRGTVRSLDRRDEIAAAVVRAGVTEPKFELVEADLNRDAGWQEAVAGCRYVLHVASPFPSKEPRDPDELIAPARDGALRVIRAASASGVERIVQTSSVAAILQAAKPEHIARTEEDWTDLDNPALASYVRSKTIAERAAWQAIAELGPGIEFCTVNPGLVLGPALDRNLSTSHYLLRLLARGSYWAIPKIAFPIVDVRDVAEQHVRAMTNPVAAGNRWLSCNGTLSLRRVGQLIVATLPDLKRKVPTIEVPSPLVRMAAHFDRNVKSARADLDKPNVCDNEKAVIQLGMRFRSPEEAVASAAQSLRSLQMI